MICSSLGVLTEARARQLKESGVSAYHHNLETARSFFDQVCTTHPYEDDVETVKIAKAAGGNSTNVLPFRTLISCVNDLAESSSHRS